ncbi:shikimate kinase [Helicovermis profundi]|uniref:Shikimate kinase n=1 Tax=Helicovermis profundi TaxID=3065157 RepID=A0AAU9E355_9FIRM|nr:shikimate kinase [Clostridia bacterium S502]
MKVFNNIYLIGMMGSGKSSISKLLSHEINFKVREMDEMIEEKFGKTINDIFNEFGESEFRIVESLVLNSLNQEKMCIISTGGGVILENDFNKIKKSNAVIYLKYSPKYLFLNLNKSISNRPLLDEENLLNKINDLYKKRNLLYKRASNIVIDCDGKNLEDIKIEILNIITVQK